MQPLCIVQLAAAFVLLLHVTCAEKLEELFRSEGNEEERIIGGTSAQAGQFPWAVALHYDGRFICTASIISPNTVMTAAHCVVLDDKNAEPANRFYGIANYKRTAQSVRIDFAKVTAHPKYGGLVDNDIALFQTTEPIPFDDETGPVCIARKNTGRMEYRNATAMGWGNTYPIRVLTNIPEELQYVEQRIVSNVICFFTNAGVNKDKICATGVFSGICNGDSGGPLVHLSANKRPVQIGITSYGNAVTGCGKGVPAVWTRVSSFYDFIMQTATDSSEICSV